MSHCILMCVNIVYGFFSRLSPHRFPLFLEPRIPIHGDFWGGGYVKLWLAQIHSFVDARAGKVRVCLVIVK